MLSSFSRLTSPTFLLYLFAALALANLWRKRRESRRRLLGLTVPFLVLSVLCMPATGYLAFASLEWPYPPLEQRPDDTEAIVVLGGYLFSPDGTRASAELGEDTLARCLKALELYHQGRPCPILVSGGRVDLEQPSPTLAEAMRDFLVQRGVSASDVLVEDTSRNTYENAVESCRLLHEQGITKIVLITDATHLYRGLACFRRQGYDAVPCGCRYRATKFRGTLFDFLPNPSSARGMEVASHEWIGTAWYWLKGRL